MLLYSNTEHLKLRKLFSLLAANQSEYPNTRFERGSFESRSGSIGFKVNPVADLIASFNVLIGLNNAGLQARVTPLVGLSYAF